MTDGGANLHQGRAQDGGQGSAQGFRSAGRRRLIVVLILISSFMGVEVVAGVLSGSLALLADAGHMLTDAGSIGLALFAMWAAGKPPSAQSTFGFQRAEILAALMNTLALWGVAAWIFFEAYRRFADAPEVAGGPMIAVGAAGLVVNLIAAQVLRRDSARSLNVEGARQHVMADLLGSVGVVVSGALTLSFGWGVADPAVSALIGLLILKSSLGLFTRVFKALMEGAPAHIDVVELRAAMEAAPGAALVHDIHAWTITSGYEALTAHVLVDAEGAADPDGLLARLREIAYGYGFAHVTLQIERSADDCAEEYQAAPSAPRA